MGKRAGKPNLLGRAVAASRVVAVIRLLPYLLATLIVVSPLAVATTWGPFLAYYDKAREAFGDGRVVDGVANLLQIVLLTIPIAGLTLILMLVGKRLGTAAWKWSEGKPALRTGLLSVRFGLAIIGVVTAGVMLFTLPNVDKAKATGHTLKDQVATLLVGEDAANASSEEMDSKPENKLYSILAGSVLAPQPAEVRGSETSSNKQTSGRADGTTSPKPSPATPASSAALDPKVPPVPTVVTAPPVSTEEPAIAAPTTAPPTEEPTTTAPPSDSSPPPESPSSQPPPPSESPPPTAPSSESPPPTTSPPPQSPPPSGSSPPPEGQAPPNTTQISVEPSPNSKYLSFTYP